MSFNIEGTCQGVVIGDGTVQHNTFGPDGFVTSGEEPDWDDNRDEDPPEPDWDPRRCGRRRGRDVGGRPPVGRSRARRGRPLLAGDRHVTDYTTGCICAGCQRGLTNSPGGQCMRCKVGDMPPGLAKAVATALLPMFNSDLAEERDGITWMADCSGRAATSTAVSRQAPDAEREPNADIEAA